MAATSIPGLTDADIERALGRLTVVVSELSDVVIEAAHGHTGFLIGKKRFAWLMVDHHGDGRFALWIKAPKDEQQALVAGDPTRYFLPPYMAVHGWVAANMAPTAEPDWDEIAALFEQGWRMSAGKRIIAALDARRGEQYPR